MLPEELFQKLIPDGSHASLLSPKSEEGKNSENNTGRHHFNWTVPIHYIMSIANLRVTVFWRWEAKKNKTWQLDKSTILIFNHLINRDLLCSPFSEIRDVKCPSHLVDALLRLKGIFNIPSISFSYIFSLENCFTMKRSEARFIIIIHSNINKHINKCLLQKLWKACLPPHINGLILQPLQEKLSWA